MTLAKRFIILTTCFLSLAIGSSANAANEGLSFKEYLEQANTYIKAYRHFEASDALKEATKLGGAKHPSLHMRLGILYYGLGLISEAIAEGEKAVTLAPSSKWYKYDLAKFYYVDKQYDKAEEQFIRLLKLDPGFTLGYYYLAELYYGKKEYDMAWLSLNRARLLGHKGRHLEEKLRPLSSQPEENFATTPQTNTMFRFIKLSSPKDAQDILDEIWNGKLFENLELELKKEQPGGVDFGVMMLSELKDSIAESLRSSEPYSPPIIVQTGPDYRIMQRIVPFDPESWRSFAINVSTSIEPEEKVAAVTQPQPPAGMTEQEDSKSILSETTAPAIDETQDTLSEPQEFSSRLAAFYALENWRSKWVAQDVEGYLAAYSDKFSPPNGRSLEAWKNSRRKSLTRPSYIEVALENPVVELLNDYELLITFKQSYTSNTYQDIVIKTLTMAKEAEGWRIIEEREISKIYP